MMMHFERLMERCGVRGWGEGHQTLTLDRAGFVAFVRSLLDEASFDEAWYLAAYADVREAIARGECRSGFEHYREFGYFEGRLPGFKGFDAQRYVTGYPDLAVLPNDQAAKDHFFVHGYREGRSPAGDPGR
jgi:hypothetical protein